MMLKVKINQKDNEEIKNKQVTKEDNKVQKQ